jgi:hypothetical protein
VKPQKTRKTSRVDMSPEAVTARIKRAGGLGDAERLMTIIKQLEAEIRGETSVPELLFLIAKREGRISE